MLCESEEIVEVRTCDVRFQAATAPPGSTLHEDHCWSAMAVLLQVQGRT